MVLFGGVIPVKGITFLMFSVFVILCLGYLLGRITIKGVSLGTAGVFIVALLYGAIFGGAVTEQLPDYSTNALKILENLGLVWFVAAVGFIAGPNFFKNLKKNFKSYILLGLIIILSGGIVCFLCWVIGKGSAEDPRELAAMCVGILSGALTSTPAFSAAKATVAEEYEAAVTVGHGIAYIYGVIGVVLFVQLVPKILKADMAAERAKITVVDTGETKKESKKLMDIDLFGYGAIALAIVIGIIVGAIKIPLSSAGLSGTTFSLTTTGGVLITSLVLAHFGHIGPFNMRPDEKVLNVMREFGLAFFLIGAGIAGGISFVKYFNVVYLVYGIFMTTVPMFVGYFFARYVLKLSLFNNLGSICGGMTSTPALGTLINVTGTADVASAYAATYPIALVAVVLVSQFLVLICDALC